MDVPQINSDQYNTLLICIAIVELRKAKDFLETKIEIVKNDLASHVCHGPCDYQLLYEQKLSVLMHTKTTIEHKLMVLQNR